MDDILTIKCPWCSAVLSVKNQPGIEAKRLTCPVCKKTQPFTAFKLHTPGMKNMITEDHTVYPGMKGDALGPGILPADDPRTSTVGELVDVAKARHYPLKFGRNVVGRKADASMADIQIPTDGQMHMSREHLVIEVKNVPAKGIVHYVSLFKERVNKTFVDNEELFFGDKIILSTGMVIKLPDVHLRFEIPDDDATTLG